MLLIKERDSKPVDGYKILALNIYKTFYGCAGLIFT